MSCGRLRMWYLGVVARKMVFMETVPISRMNNIGLDDTVFLDGLIKLALNTQINIFTVLQIRP